MKWLFTCVAFSWLLLSGCASDPAPTEQLRLTRQAIEQARAVGADEQVEALAQAVRKLTEAEAAFAKKAYRQARLLAEQAELDARLAEVTVLDEKSRAQSQSLKQRIEQLRQQLGGAT